MALAAHNIDARQSTINHSGRDIHNHYYSTPIASEPSQPSSIPPFNDAPIDLLSSHFTGREKELQDIGNALDVTYGDTPTRCIVGGMPGIGKTQLMLKYVAISYDQQRYHVVFWISGATVEKVNQGFTKVLTLVGHQDHSEQSTRLTSARRWLEESTIKWLLVLDNVSQEVVTFLREHLPRKNRSGHVLLTTRSAVVAEAIATVAGQQHHVFELQTPNLKDAAKLLVREAGVNAGKASVAEAVVKRVGCLPLAISHAASFAKQSHKNLDDLLGLYQSTHQYEMISWENSLSGYEQKSVAATFATQLDELERQFPNSCNLLKVLSFWDPESISLPLIVDGAEELHLRSVSNTRSSGLDGGTDDINSTSVVSPTVESLIALILSPVQLQHAIQQFLHLSLVRYESSRDTSTLRIHDLIQIMIREHARRTNSHHEWFSIATTLACGAFRRVQDPKSHTCWAQCETFSPIIQSLTKWDDEHTIGNSELDRANIRIAEYLDSRGRFGEAEKLFARALAGNEKLLGSEHSGTLRTAMSLANVYRRQGRYSDAEILYERVLAVNEKLLGPDRQRTLRTVECLAVVYQAQGRYTDAETLNRRVLSTNEKILGPDHPTTLLTVHNLALVHWRQKRYKEAETLYRRTLTGYEKLLGPEHPDTLGTVEGLALVYYSLRKYGEAERLFERALAGNEKALGPEHPHTLRTVDNLALVYSLQGRYSEAEALYGRTLETNDKILGPDHPDTTKSSIKCHVMRALK